MSLRSLIKETAQDRQSFNFYSPSGRLLKAVNAEGFVTEFEYDNAGHVLVRHGALSQLI